MTHLSTTRSSSSRRAIVLSIACLIAIVSLGLRFLTVRSLSNDHYMHMAWAQQVLLGELPGRDFVDPGMPLMYLLSAFAQWVDPGPFSEALMTCALLAIAAAVTYVVVAEITGSLLTGLAAALFEIALQPRLYSYPKILVPAVTLLLMLHYVRRPSRRGVALLAVWTGVAVLLRHDLGVYACAGVGTGLLITHWQKWPAVARALIEYAAAVVLVMIPYVVFVTWAEGLGEHFHEALEFAKGEAHQRFFEPPAFPFVQDPHGLAGWSTTDSAVFLFYVAHLIALVAFVLLLTRRRSQRAAALDETVPPGTTALLPVVGAALTIMVMYLAVVLRHPIQVRIQDLAAPFVILGSWIMAELASRALAPSTSVRPTARAVFVPVFAGSVLVAAAAIGSTWNLGTVTEQLRDTEVTEGLDHMERMAAGIRETGTQWPWTRFWPAGALPEAVRYINACTAQQDAVLLTWAAPEYYYFAQRRFGAGHALFLPPDAFTGAEDQALMVTRLRKDRVPIVLINETRRAEFAAAYPQVDDYLQHEYVAAGHFQIREGSDVTIAIRRSLKPERSYGSEGWPCGFDSRAASSTASTMLEESATPFPEISNAVP